VAPIEPKDDAVLVETPSCKLAPPPQGSRGKWISAADGERTLSRCIDEEGVMRGFGLSLHK